MMPSMPIAAVALLEVPLLTAAGAPTRLQEQLGAQATVVVFLRHFG